MTRPPRPTIILIGGASTAGKSTLTRTLAAHLDARVVDTDLFWMVLRRTTPPEIAPDLDFFTSDDCWTLPRDELVALHIRVSQFVCTALESVVDHYAAEGVTAILEGTWLLPDFAVQPTYAGRDIGPVVHSLFLHEPYRDDLAYRLLVRDDHRGPRPEPRLHEINIEMQWRYANEVKRRAEALHLPVITSRPFDTLLDRALTALDLPPPS